MRALTLSRLGATDALKLNGDRGVCVRACMRVRACASARVHDVFAIYDNNISHRLIMIIIKIIFLYFIQIRHTDDFPSMGTRLVCNNVVIMSFVKTLYLLMIVIVKTLYLHDCHSIGHYIFMIVIVKTLYLHDCHSIGHYIFMIVIVKTLYPHDCHCQDTISS